VVTFHPLNRYTGFTNHSSSNNRLVSKPVRSETPNIRFSPAVEVPMDQPNFSGQGVYEIKVKGHLDEQWSSWFDGLQIITGFNEEGIAITTFTGTIVDQAALHGVIARVRDIHMPLISINQIKPE